MPRLLSFSLLMLSLLLLVCTPFVAGDLESRLKKLEEELKHLKAKAESSVFDELPATWHRVSSNVMASVGRFTATVTDHVNKEGPKYVKAAQAFAQDVPRNLAVLYNLAQKEGAVHYAAYSKQLAAILSRQGVPKEYVHYAVLAIAALIGTIALLATFSILTTLFGCLYSCCCGTRGAKKSHSKKHKNQAQPQHNGGEKKQ